MGKQLYGIVFLLALILAGCAQVGSISGGEEDVTPPKVVENGIDPPNGSLRFQQKTITFRFNEYIKLNSPAETVSLVPADAKVKVESRKKTLTLTIEGELKPETTYAIYLNGTVQDITEGNDSLIQYVFSTGNFIDTLKYTGFVTDAFTYKPLKDVFVGLYPAQDSGFVKKPAYFSKSEASGKFNLYYVKPGSYKILAFEDKNKDMLLQKSERVGFSNSLVQVDSSMTDSIPLRIFSQPSTRRITGLYQGPSLINVASNKSLDSAQFFLDGQKLEINHTFGRDSISFLFDHQNRNQQKLVVQFPTFTDTITVRTFEKDRTKRPTFETNLQNGTIPRGKNLEVRFTDYIISYDTSLIELRTKDSLKLNYSLIKLNENLLEVIIDTNAYKEYNLNILNGSIVFKNNTVINSSTINIKNKTERDFGAVLLSVENIPDYAIIEVMKGNNVVKSYTRTQIGEKLLIPYLDADTYTFRAILDQNGNGKWDDGNLEKQLQPEEILFFTKGVKVRPNWEMEVTLIPEP